MLTGDYNWLYVTRDRFTVNVFLRMKSQLDATNQQVVQTTLRWIESVVIGLDLCPFAKKEVRSDRLRLIVSNANATLALLEDLEAEITYLVENPDTETSLLIHPDCLQSFAAYNDFLSSAEGLLSTSGHDGRLQIASFHPHYQFAGTDADDAENYSNRSPYPMLHLLREDRVAEAVSRHPDTAQIPADNIKRLNSIGKTRLQKIFKDCYSKTPT